MNGTARGGVPSSTLPSSLLAEEGRRNGNDALLLPTAPGGEGGEYVAPVGDAGCLFSTGGMLLLVVVAVVWMSFCANHGGTSDVWRLCMKHKGLRKDLSLSFFGSVRVTNQCIFSAT